MSQFTKLENAEVSKDGVPVYGIDKELKAKANAKWESEGKQMEIDAGEWIKAVLSTDGEPFDYAAGGLQAALKDGIALCKLVNIIMPGCCKKPSPSPAPFKQMENIGNYLAACTEKIGVPVTASFQTVSLFEDQDMLAVLRQIHALGSKAQQIGYSGPTLGAKLAIETPREFSAETIAAGASSVGLIGKGSHGFASQAGTFDTSRNIDKGVGAGVAVATADDLGVIGKGSAGGASQAGMIDTSKNIVKSTGVAVAQTTADISKMGLGSSGCASQAGTSSISKEIVKLR